jgi:two-component system LytT family response regulator
MTRALIVEDSELARFELRHLLSAHPHIEIIAEAADVQTAVTQIEALSPDLVLLDIDLPDGTAFDILPKLEHIPPLIFTTAFDAYALQAFDYHTIDYLLKPIEPKRLAQAIARLTPASAPATSAASAASAALLAESPIYLKDGDKTYLVKVKDIRLIEAIGNYSRVHVGPHAPMIYRALSAIEARLDPTQFFRCSRQHLVNLAWVEALMPWSNGAMRLRLRGGQEVDVSRRQSLRLKDQLSL